ncbi:MAG: glycosyltransferase family 39 protein [Armatimonadetes bacterium]|nr:glycosyltransferase family 39 protein [Armatimonadota bacterium]
MTKTIYRLAVLALVITSGALALWGLDRALFWDDEAHIAIVARNFLASGRLSAWDGRNLIGYRDGAFVDSDLCTRNPPLDALVMAGSFRLFGPTTWAGRFPFVLVGLATLFLLSHVVEQQFRSRPVALYSLAVLGLGVVFLLNIRTGRYNALALLLPLCAFAAYNRYLECRRPSWLGLSALAGVALFYASYLLALAFGLALAVLALVRHRHRFSRSDIWPLALAAGLFLAATLPYILVYRAWDYPRLARDPAIPHFFTLLWWYVQDLPRLAPGLWVVGAIAWLIRPERDERALDWVVLCAAYLVALSGFSPQPVSITDTADTRYALPIAPFLAGLTGWVLGGIHGRSPVLAGLLLVGLVCVDPRVPPQPLLPAYVQENLQPYPTGIEAVVEFLRPRVAFDEPVACTPAYMNVPLMFYLGDRVRICCQLTHESPLPASLVSSLPAPLGRESCFPDRLVAFGWSPTSREVLSFYQRGGHRYQLEAVLPVYWRQTQRPELVWHTFGPRRDFSTPESVYVLRRVR